MKEVQLKDAKSNLSTLVDEAMDGETFVITRHGKPQAIVVSVSEWERLSNVPSFGRLLASAPEGAGDLPARSASGMRGAGL